MIGQTISHYKILEKLGEGGMGVVYKGLDTTLDRDVAIKFLPPQLQSDKDAKKRFVHEAKAASALNHANIAVVHEVDETPEGLVCFELDRYLIPADVILERESRFTSIPSRHLRRLKTMREL